MCPECGVKLKTNNFDRHMKQRHPNAKYEVEKTNNNNNSSTQRKGISKGSGVKIASVIIVIIIIVILTSLSFNYFINNNDGTPNEENVINEPPPTNNDIDEPVVKQNTVIDKSKVSDGALHEFKYDTRSYFVHKNPLGNYRVRFIDCKSCKEQCQYPDKPMFSTVEGGAIINCDRCSTQWDSEYYTFITGSCEDGPPKQVITTEDSEFIYIDVDRNG
jgi:hypothetical protein